MSLLDNINNPRGLTAFKKILEGVQCNATSINLNQNFVHKQAEVSKAVLKDSFKLDESLKQLYSTRDQYLNELKELFTKEQYNVPEGQIMKNIHEHLKNIFSPIYPQLQGKLKNYKQSIGAIIASFVTSIKEAIKVEKIFDNLQAAIDHANPPTLWAMFSRRTKVVTFMSRNKDQIIDLIKKAAETTCNCFQRELEIITGVQNASNTNR